VIAPRPARCRAEISPPTAQMPFDDGLRCFTSFWRMIIDIADFSLASTSISMAASFVADIAMSRRKWPRVFRRCRRSFAAADVF